MTTAIYMLLKLITIFGMHFGIDMRLCHEEDYSAVWVAYSCTQPVPKYGYTHFDNSEWEANGTVPAYALIDYGTDPYAFE